MLDGVIASGYPGAHHLCRFKGGKRPSLPRDMVVEDEAAPTYFNGGIRRTGVVNLPVTLGSPLEAEVEVLCFAGVIRFIIRPLCVDDMGERGGEAGVAVEVLVGSDILHGSISLA